MTLWEAMFCLCRRDNHAVHPVSVAHESVPVPNNPAPVVQQPIPQTPIDAPVENGDVPIMAEATKEDDAVQNPVPAAAAQVKQLETLAPAEEIQTTDLPVEEEEKDEERPNSHLTVSPKSIEEHQANEEEAKIPEDLQPEVKRLSIDTLASTKAIDPVVETLEKAAWIVQSFSQERGSLEEPQENHAAEIEDPAKEENNTAMGNHEPEEKPLETIKEGEPLPTEKVKPTRVDLNGSAEKWEPNDAKAHPKHKIIKVKATAVRENKKPVSTRSIDQGKTNSIPQVRFQPPRRNSVPAKKEPKKATKKKVESSEESQGEVVLISPTEQSQVVNNIHDTSEETSATVGTETTADRLDEEELPSNEASNN